LFSLFAASFSGGATIFQIGSDSWLTFSGQLLNQMDSSYFAWHTQNSLFAVKYTKKVIECQKSIDDY
jgi:hypothetical protein